MTSLFVLCHMTALIGFAKAYHNYIVPSMLLHHSMFIIRPFSMLTCLCSPWFLWCAAQIGVVGTTAVGVAETGHGGGSPPPHHVARARRRTGPAIDRHPGAGGGGSGRDQGPRADVARPPLPEVRGRRPPQPGAAARTGAPRRRRTGGAGADRPRSRTTRRPRPRPATAARRARRPARRRGRRGRRRRWRWWARRTRTVASDASAAGRPPHLHPPAAHPPPRLPPAPPARAVTATDLS